MTDLENLLPEEDMNLEPEREEVKNGEVQFKRRIPVEDKSKSIHKKKHQKKKAFKAGDKDVKFEAYNERRNNDKALAFIRQFEVAFAEGNFKERSKLRHVGMYLKGMASSWWLTQILEGKKPKDWSAFKKAFYSQFLPPDFEQEVRKEWDRLFQWEDESVPQFVDKFWDVLLEVTSFKKIEDSEKMLKFEAGLHDTLQKAMKLYPRHNLPTLIKSARIADSIHQKGTPRKFEQSMYHAKQKALSIQPKSKNISKKPNQP
ncbi:hypothetical protein L7F22_030296 [Adiantum nelumboides]|nr:hypothetical protein [Adiantum nelumboides]